MRMLRLLLPLALCCAACASPASSQAGLSERVVLVTLDGARWQEIFTGLDEAILQASAGASADIKTLPVYKAFSGATPVERREKLMPFLWRTLAAEHGYLAGDRAAGSNVNITNTHKFSYPGYSEILTGEAHDAEIKSNDPIRNPFPTVLEFIKAKRQLTAAEVATFASWNVFSAIVEHQAGSTTVNAGRQEYLSPAPWMTMASALQTQAAPAWGGVRHDAFTFRFAIDYLQRIRPRVLYIAFDETDDWAHDGKYDRVLEMLHETDGFLRELWSALQADPDFRGKTTLIVTVDHGRGRTAADWRRHGKDVAGAEEIWLGVFSPAATRRGVWPQVQLFQNQIAATMAAALGLDYSSGGKAIDLR